jgi:signal transduction histidine kinase
MHKNKLSKVWCAKGMLRSGHRWVGLCVLALALWLGLATGASANVCDSPSRITQALREVTLNGRLIDQSVVNIPDKLANAWRREGIKIRYTLDVDDCDGAAEQTIWLPRVGGPYQFRVQGRPALPVHPFIAPAQADQTDGRVRTFNGRTSMMFRIPPGTTRVSVELQTLPYIPAGVALAEHGPFAAMLPLQMHSYNEQSGGMTIVSLITALIGFVAIVLWRTRQIDRFIFWFGLMCLMWGIRGYFYASDEVTLPSLIFEQINPFTVGLFAITCLKTTLLLLNRSTAKYNRFFIISATALVTSYALSLIAGSGAALVRAASFGFGLLMLNYTGYVIWRERAQLGIWRAGLIVAGFAVLITASVHDVLIVVGLLSPDRTSLILVGFTTLLVAYAVVCAHYVIRTLNQVEASNEQLETRVKEKTQALEQSYEKLRTIELTQAQAQERERLLRDMHDGVGAQLMSALRGLERGVLDKETISNALQDGLDDLRMLMDNADPQATFTDRLAAWRSRWDARLTSLGIQLHWQLGDDLDDLALPGDTALQLQRVVQEACTNVIKHAQATDIWLTAQRTKMPEGPTLYIQIRDNGNGISTQSTSACGRGMTNMRLRARQIGAYLAIEPPPLPDNGCCVRLWLPLPA